jgi:hypothetical protein
VQILTNSSTSTRALVQRPPAKATPLPKANLDSVSFGVFQPASKHMGAPQNPKKSSNKWKGALIGGAAGALIGGVGGAIGGSVGSVATAPVVAFMGGAAAASTYTFRGNGKTMTAQAEARSVFTRLGRRGRRWSGRTRHRSRPGLRPGLLSEAFSWNVKKPTSAAPSQARPCRVLVRGC